MRPTLHLCFPVLFALFALLVSSSQTVRCEPPEEEIDLSGVWHSTKGDLVLRRAGGDTWMGYPTEGRAALGRTWHFHALGGESYQFWIIVDDGATTRKLDDQRISITGERDQVSLALTNRAGKREEIPWRRLLAPVPKRVGEVTIGFVPAKGLRVLPDQDLDVRLVHAFARAVATARQADPGLKRLNVCGTIDYHTSFSKRHSRFARAALHLDLVNGAGTEHWEKDVEAKLDALKDGIAPDVDLRRDYARHTTALILALLLEEDLSEVICPALLSEKTIPYLEWWLTRYGKEFPERAPSIVGWRKKIEGMLETTRTRRRKLKQGLYVAVKEGEEPLPLGKKAFDKRYDRQ